MIVGEGVQDYAIGQAVILVVRILEQVVGQSIGVLVGNEIGNEVNDGRSKGALLISVNGRLPVVIEGLLGGEGHLAQRAPERLSVLR